MIPSFTPNCVQAFHIMLHQIKCKGNSKLFLNHYKPVSQLYLEYHVVVKRQVDADFVINNDRSGLSGPNHFTSSFSSRENRLKGQTCRFLTVFIVRKRSNNKTCFPTELVNRISIKLGSSLYLGTAVNDIQIKHGCC